MINFKSDDCIEALNDTMRELAISQTELSNHLNVNIKTVSRWLSGETKISAKKKELIDKYIDERSRYGEYVHQSSKIFAKRVESLLEEFSYAITQEKLAELVGLKNQSQISKITSEQKWLTTKQQYDILSVFLKLCTNQDAYQGRGFDAENVYRQHYDTARELYLTLYGNTYSFDQFEEYKNNEFTNFGIRLTLINYLITLPYNAQELILSAPKAFFDSLEILYFDLDHERNSLYPSVSEFMTTVDSLSRGRRIVFQNLLEELTAEKKVFSYYDHRDNWDLFDAVTQYRSMIRSAKNRRIADTTETLIYFGRRIDGYEPIYNYSIDNFRDEEKDRKINLNMQFRRFEAVIYDLIHFNRLHYSFDMLTDLIIEDIEYRLTMCPYEWYLWMLYASYVFAYQEDDTIYELLEDVDSGKYDDRLDSFYV